MRCTFPFAALTALLFSVPAAAQLSPQQRDPAELEVEGTGKTEQQALENALLEAIHRTVGVVEKESTVTRRLDLVTAGVRDQLAAGGTETETVSRVAAASKGLVRSYRVLEQSRTDDTCRVKIAATMAHFDKANLRDEPFTVVVVPIRAAAGQYVKDTDGEVQRTPLDLAPLARQLRQVVEQQLVQSKAFQVLDRQDLALADSELARIRAGECAPAELARLQQRLSGDYLLQAEIRSGTARLELRSLSVPGWSGRVGHDFEVAYTLLEVATGRIVKSGAIRSADWPEKRAVVPSAELDLDTMFGDLAARTVPHLVDAFTDDLDPLLVATVEQRDGRTLATLTQGGSRLHVGDRFDVVEEGKPILHPRTGAVLAHGQKHLGELIVVDTAGPLAIGELATEGAAVAPGAIVRRKPAAGVTLQ